MKIKYLPTLFASAALLIFAGCNEQATGTAGGYPLTTCVVSGKSLTSMGEPVVVNHKGTTVKFCCDSCIDDFNKDPEKYLAKLKTASR